ncbi:hypothetical protein C7212DRAFT_326214 [Tuber magnatum]|uniref:Uncharacterized protein n=1 Tax=Tuber magnatum TaxID=42249 RepID=A0A317SL95_9PEZI|nr:hypothetical protein C7212DRAFT_326214 [Tuber magnatum]
MSAWVRYTGASATIRAAVGKGYNWGLKNQTLAAGVIGGVGTVGGAVGGAYLVIRDAKLRGIEQKAEANERDRKVHAHIDARIHKSCASLKSDIDARIDETCASLKSEIDMTKALVLASAVSMMRGFEGDKGALKDFISEVEKVSGCKQVGPCIVEKL